MASYNRVTLLGNLTRDPELKYTKGGTAVCEIGLAINESRTDASGNRQEEVTFVDVTLWGKTAEVAEKYLGKGSPVLIEGRLKFDTWMTDNGEKRSKLRVVGNNIQFLGQKTGEDKGGSHDRHPDESPF